MAEKKEHQHTLRLKPDWVSVLILSFGIGSGAKTYFAETDTFAQRLTKNPTILKMLGWKITRIFLMESFHILLPPL